MNKKERNDKIDLFAKENNKKILEITMTALKKFKENPDKIEEIMEERDHNLELLSKKITTGLVNILREGIKEEKKNE